MDVRKSSLTGTNLSNVQEIILSCDSSDEDDTANQQTKPQTHNRNQSSNAAEKSVTRTLQIPHRPAISEANAPFVRRGTTFQVMASRQLECSSFSSDEGSVSLRKLKNLHVNVVPTSFLLEKAALALRKLTANQDMKFMDNFDPESSNREKRKLTQKSNQGKKAGNAYDEKGILIASGKDLCDCLEDDCPGCHFPCPKCRSLKCGPECRQNRKYTFDSVEAEGTNIVIRNKYK